MKKGADKKELAAKKAERKARKRNLFLALSALMVVAVIVLVMFLLKPWGTPASREFLHKAELLAEEVLTEELSAKLGDDPAGKAGFAVFFSVCDGKTRAQVYSGTGKTLKEAWDQAKDNTEKAEKSGGPFAKWVKADVVFKSEPINAKELNPKLRSSIDSFYRYGLALDKDFGTALLEAELNSTKSYDYNNGIVDLANLNLYFEESGRKNVTSLPTEYIQFQTFGWLCDENDEIFELNSSGLEYGRRSIEHVDADFAKYIIDSNASFLVDEMHDDGTFVYSVLPRFDKELEWYNVTRHAGALWALISDWRVSHNNKLKPAIDKALDYMLSQVRTFEDGVSHLYWENRDDFELGADALAVIALADYIEAFDSKEPLDVCISLGEGIVSLQDQEKGSFVHVLNTDLSIKSDFETVFYDGEAVFALIRLYELTGEQRWLDSALLTIGHMIREDYADNNDQWLSYAMNYITKHIDNEDYYTLGFNNYTRGLSYILARQSPAPTRLEQLMETFELYDRMVQSGKTPDIDISELLSAIRYRIQRQLDGRFFPEVAMYMANPERILNGFMIRQENFRIRMDEVQHNICGFYLYWKNYDKLVEYGLLDAVKAD